MTTEEHIYKKSLRYAKWSFVGILAPLLGLVLALIARYAAILTADSDRGEERLRRFYSISRWGIIVSLWPLWAIIVVILVTTAEGAVGT